MNPLGLGKDMKMCGSFAIFSGAIDVRCHLLLVALLGCRDQCHLGTPAMCFPWIFPGQEFLPLPRLFQCFSILSTRSLFSYCLNHSCHRLGLFLPAQPWKLSDSLSLQQLFMHFTVNLSFLGLPTHVIRSQASAQVGFSSSYCQVVPVFLDVAQTQGLPGTHSGLTRQLRLPRGGLGEKTPIF